MAVSFLKNKKILKIVVLLLVVITGLHFVPVYSKVGSLDKESIAKPGTISPDLCQGYIGYRAPLKDDYHLVFNGLGGFKTDKSILKPPDIRGCEDYVHLRLYIL
jgi:hypothetical protein